jgi:NAD(P)-dependent dehydrogenase (short-subunit alcohol dehydrogenase family)
LAEQGCDVVVNVHSRLADAEAVADEVRALGRRATPIAADVADAAAVGVIVERPRAEQGRIDVLVNCAAKRLHGGFLELSDEEWQDGLGVVLQGPINTCRAVLPLMLAQGTGSIVNISGTVVYFGSWTHMATVKSALHGLTRGLAHEFGPRGVRANVIVPSTIETVRDHPQAPAQVAAEIARTPLGRLGQPREVADVCVFLASERSSYVTGQAIHVNGGQLMP